MCSDTLNGKNFHKYVLHCGGIDHDVCFYVIFRSSQQGHVAQLVARLTQKLEVTGSIPDPTKGARRIIGSSYIFYNKVYSSSCSQGQDLIDRVKSLPKQMKITASICKHILCDNDRAPCSGKDASTH